MEAPPFVNDTVSLTVEETGDVISERVQWRTAEHPEGVPQIVEALMGVLWTVYEMAQPGVQAGYKCWTHEPRRLHALDQIVMRGFNRSEWL